MIAHEWQTGGKTPITCNHGTTTGGLRQFRNRTIQDTAWPGICHGYHNIHHVVHDVDFASVLHFANVACCPPGCQSRAKMNQALLLLFISFGRWSLGTRLSLRKSFLGHFRKWPGNEASIRQAKILSADSILHLAAMCGHHNWSQFLSLMYMYMYITKNQAVHNRIWT